MGYGSASRVGCWVCGHRAKGATLERMKVTPAGSRVVTTRAGGGKLHRESIEGYGAVAAERLSAGEFPPLTVEVE
jgi:hypothetical protein